MRRILLALLIVELALIGYVLTSCTETPLEPQATSYPMKDFGAGRVSDTNVIQSVSGNGHVIGEPPERTVTFDIRKRADGSVEGWYNALTQGPGGAQIRVRMECLHVVGNQAWASGTIIAAVNPDNVGRPVSLRFIDNGEGVNAPSDEIGGIWEEHDCGTEPGHTTRPLTIGNLQIRG